MTLTSPAHIRKGLSFLIISIFFVMSATEAQAYRCVRVPLQLQNIDEYKAIFEGKVITAKEGFFNKYQDVVFNSSMFWLGQKVDEITIKEDKKGGGGCGYNYGFQEGESYLVFAKEEKGTLKAGAYNCVCAMSSLLTSKQAQQDILFLKSLND